MTELTWPDLPDHAVGMIWARTRDGVIGRDGDMPWRAPEDMAHFKAITMGHPVVMGRRTWESIPPRFRPFAGRTNIVLTRDPDAAVDIAEQRATVVADLTDALELATREPGGELTWITGGGSVYASALERTDVVVVTVLDLDVPDGDTFAPDLADGFALFSASPSADGFHPSEVGPAYRFEVWARR